LDAAPLPPVLAPPGGRRLLKGGVSGGAGGGRFGGGGTLRSSAAMRAPSVRSHAGGFAVAYGGRGSYAVGGRTYRTSASEQRYYYRQRVITTGATFYFVGRRGFGCYSCVGSRRTCEHCDGCTTRSSCAVATPTATSEALDGYELEASFDAPASARSIEWPLTLSLSNVTLFVERGALNTSTARGGAPLYVSAYTRPAEADESFNPRVLLPTCYILTILTIWCVCRHQESLFAPRRPRRGPRESGRESGRNERESGRGDRRVSRPHGMDVVSRPGHGMELAQGVPAGVPVVQGCAKDPEHAAYGGAHNRLQRV
jgi:hypothetical protein